ncbi:IclR family transcriptional regulator [Micrococcales bacterium 31B]|nr:IclR family transcriptional regulator [Micrococcales bacterium 31B]
MARAVAIMDLVSRAGARGLNVADVARELGLAKSSTGNLCAELEAAGLLERNEVGLVLGRKTLDWAGGYLASNDQVGQFYRQCRRLPLIAREAAKLALLDGADVLFLARYDGTNPIRLTAHVGDRFPVTATATGKAMMATLSPEVVADRLRDRPFSALTGRSILTLEAYLEELESVRERGFAYDDEEVTPGVVCYAAAVQDGLGVPARLAVSVTLLKVREAEVDTAQLVSEVKELARFLSNPLHATGH